MKPSPHCSVFRLLVWCACVSWLNSEPAGAATPGFVYHVVDADSECHSCAVFDVNGDGQRDIVTGAAWYAGPGWQRHPVREVERIRGRLDDYACLPLDINGDGHTDLLSANYRSASIYWVQHPGPHGLAAGDPWPVHVVERPGAMETGRLWDIDDDGQPDLLPNGLGFAAWWGLQPGPQPVWTRSALPSELGAHGIGAGDINGDGRTDIVGRAGWAEAPQDRRRERWTFHSEFELERDASIPILVHDVDADGDADLVWGRGHRSGLYWLEQQTHADQQRSWVRHAIDTSWAQAHSLLLADVNGDGRSDVVAGKRFLGHDGRDPGEYDPLVSYWYQFQTPTRTWQRQPMALQGRAGFGLDPTAEDLDQDGDVDLIVADRSGLYWLENQRLPADAAAADHTQDNATEAELAEQPAIPGDAELYSDHTQVLTLRDAAGTLQPIRTPFQMAARRQHILHGMSLAMGPVPGPERRVALDVQVESEEETGRYLRRRISYAAEPGDRVPAWLLIPRERTGRMAAMLCLHQTTAIGKGEPAGLGGLPNLHYAHELAERGFVCLVPDYPSFGDYPYDFKTQGQHYASGSMKAIWNNMRAVDLLESLPEVDADRIGCIGHSLGGHNTLFTAAFDQRIRAAVTSCGFTAFHHYYEGNLAGWTSDRYMPRIRERYANSPDQVPFDFYEVLAAIAPRSVFVCAPVGDTNFENTGVRKVLAEAGKAWQIYGAAEETLTAHYPDCGHDFPTDIREAAYQWLQSQLR